MQSVVETNWFRPRDENLISIILRSVLKRYSIVNLNLHSLSVDIDTLRVEISIQICLYLDVGVSV